MTTDQAREMAAKANITVENVTGRQLMELHKILEEKLKNSGCFGGAFAMNPLDQNRMFMTCRSDYFDSREAVSFNSDGFIGLAGWASSKNIIPILEGFAEWVSRTESK